MICKIFKGIWVMLALALAVWCIGCSGSDDSTTSEQGGDFHHTPAEDVSARIEELKLLLPEETYNTITAESRDNPGCRESNREQLGLSDLPNGQWYYTYDNLIEGMAELKEFANEGDENTKKLEIAAFLANIAQETGGKVPGDEFGSPGCFIQEGGGGDGPKFRKWHDCEYGGCNKTRPFDCPPVPDNLCPDGEVGYIGRGPHQLSWDSNYKAFGETMGVGDKYLNDPDDLTKYPEIGIAGSIWFWGHEVLSEKWPQNIPFKPSAHNVLVDEWTPTEFDEDCGRTKADFGVIINLINGGIECGKGKNKPTQQATNRVNYLKAIAEEMGVTIPDGFLDNCSEQKNFAECPSYRSPTSRCGSTWADANSKCGTFCQSDDDCPDGEKCFAPLDENPCT